MSPLMASPPNKKFVPSPVKFDSSQDEDFLEDSVNNILDTLDNGQTPAGGNTVYATEEEIALTSMPGDMEVDQPETLTQLLEHMETAADNICPPAAQSC